MIELTRVNRWRCSMIFNYAMANPLSLTFLDNLDLLNVAVLNNFLVGFLESFNLTVSVLASYRCNLICIFVIIA